MKFGKKFSSLLLLFPVVVLASSNGPGVGPTLFSVPAPNDSIEDLQAGSTISTGADLVIPSNTSYITIQFGEELAEDAEPMDGPSCVIYFNSVSNQQRVLSARSLVIGDMGLGSAGVLPSEQCAEIYIKDAVVSKMLCYGNEPWLVHGLQGALRSNQFSLNTAPAAISASGEKSKYSQLQICEVADPRYQGTVSDDQLADAECLSGVSEAAKNAALCVRQKVTDVCEILGRGDCDGMKATVDLQPGIYGVCRAVAKVPSL